MLPPLSSYRNERDSLGGSNDPSFYPQSGFPTSPNVPDCRASAIGVAAGPPVSPKVATGGRGQLPSFSAVPCYLITRTDMGEYRVPLQFIPVEKING
jgi:hypothetical protein